MAPCGHFSPVSFNYVTSLKWFYNWSFLEAKCGGTHLNSSTVGAEAGEWQIWAQKGQLNNLARSLAKIKSTGGLWKEFSAKNLSSSPCLALPKSPRYLIWKCHLFPVRSPINIEWVLSSEEYTRFCKIINCQLNYRAVNSHSSMAMSFIISRML